MAAAVDGDDLHLHAAGLPGRLLPFNPQSCTEHPMSDVIAPTLETTLGEVRIISSDPKRTAIEFEVGPQMCDSGGAAQGGFVCGWIDAAMARASMALAPEMAPLTLEVRVSYFAPTHQGRVIAEGWVERRGREACFAAGRLLDAAGKVLAKASSTMRLVPRAAVEASSRRALG
jgi:uncharacterized protein (TIGR00369 family)